MKLKNEPAHEETSLSCLPTAVDQPAYLYSQISNIVIVSNSLDPDQDRQFVGPDLGPNCL